jgi:hypothetical protein
VLLVIACWFASSLRVGVVWGLSITVSFLVTAFVFFDFVPHLSQARSIHALAGDLQQNRGHLPVIYFNRQAYSASFHLDDENTHYFHADQLVEVGIFLQQNPEAILVTEPGGAETIEDAFGSLVELQSAGPRGQIHLSHARKLPTSRVGILPPKGVR